MGLTRLLFLQSGMCTPITSSKASNAAQRLQWRLNRVVKSRLPKGLSRARIQKIVDHYWAAKGEARCRDGMAKVMAGEGQRASTDHTLWFRVAAVKAIYMYTHVYKIVSLASIAPYHKKRNTVAFEDIRTPTTGFGSCCATCDMLHSRSVGELAIIQGEV